MLQTSRFLEVKVYGAIASTLSEKRSAGRVSAAEEEGRAPSQVALAKRAATATIQL